MADTQRWCYELHSWIVNQNGFHNNILSSSTVSECLYQQCSSWWHWRSEIHQIPLCQCLLQHSFGWSYQGDTSLRPQATCPLMYTVQQGCRSWLKFQIWLVHFTLSRSQSGLVLICLTYFQCNLSEKSSVWTRLYVDCQRLTTWD